MGWFIVLDGVRGPESLKRPSSTKNQPIKRDVPDVKAIEPPPLIYEVIR